MFLLKTAVVLEVHWQSGMCGFLWICGFVVSVGFVFTHILGMPEDNIYVVFCLTTVHHFLLTAAAGIVWLFALVGIPSGYRRGRCWQAGRTRTRTDRAVVYNWTAVAHWTR